MPAYLWECTECGEVTEIVTSVSNRDITPDTPCAQCDEIKWSRKLTLANFSWKCGGKHNHEYSKTGPRKSRIP